MGVGVGNGIGMWCFWGKTEMRQVAGIINTYAMRLGLDGVVTKRSEYMYT